MNMEGAKRTPLSARKKPMRKSRRLVKSIVAYLKSDSYLYAPLFSDLPPSPPQIQAPPPSNIVSPVAEKFHVTNLVTREVSTTSKTMMHDNNNYRNLRSGIAEHSLNNGKINSPKRPRVILDGRRTGLSRETEEKTVKPDPRRVPIE